MITAKDFFMRLSNIADHDFGKEFDDKFWKGTLTETEQSLLIMNAECHIKYMLSKRSPIDFKQKQRDNDCLKILSELMPEKPLLGQIGYNPNN